MLRVDVTRLRQWKNQFLRARASKQCELRKYRVAAEFDRFIHAISSSARNGTQATDHDVVDWLCFLDTQRDGIAVVHTSACAEFGAKAWGKCSRTLGCVKRYAIGSLDNGYIIKLRAACSDLLRRGRECLHSTSQGIPR